MSKNPGPINKTVLYDQDNHISSKIWDFQEYDPESRISNITSNLGIKQWKLNKRQQELVKSSGFGFLLRPGNVVRTDVSLLNALIERWRPETNTFHLPVGECTITLEDVSFILGIPPGGTPIVEAPLKRNQYLTFLNFFKIRGITKGEWDSDGIKLTWLRENYITLPEGYTEEDEEMSVKAFLLDGIGSVLIPDGSKNKINGKYCKFLEVLSEVIGYAWGAATLARTYRALYKASRCKQGIFQGCSTLLQIWAWSRVAISRPNPRPGSEFAWPRVEAYAFDGTTKDKYKRKWRRVGPHHSGIMFPRGELDLYSTHSLFEWEPYSHFYKLGGENSPYECYKELGCSCIPLIHFIEIEYQLPNRVTRQFGYPIEIPENPVVNLNTFRVYQKKSDFERVNAIAVYSQEIEEWMLKVVHGRNAVYHPNPARQVPLGEYLEWYRQITRLRINPPRKDEEPTDEYYPRDLYEQKGCYGLVEKAAQCIQNSQKYIPEEAAECKEQAIQWERKYKDWSRTNIDPTFDFNVFGNELQSSQQSYVTEESLITPYHQSNKDVALQQRDQGLTKTAPAAPFKDKGKRPFLGNGQAMAVPAPSFDLGLGFTESQEASQPYQIPGYDDDGDINRLVPQFVLDWINENWFSKEGPAALLTVPVLGPTPLSIETLKCLRPEEELWEQVMTEYIRLLTAREMVRPPPSSGKHRKTFWVADVTFLSHCHMNFEEFLKWDKKRGEKAKFRYNGNVLAMLRASDGSQPAIDDGREFALIPFIKKLKGGGNHYSLLVVDLNKMTTIFVDSLTEDRKELMSIYTDELNIVFLYLASVLRDEFNMNVPVHRGQERPIYVWKNTPQQVNGKDCGIFVLRKIDFFLRDKEGERIPKKWSQQQVFNFRYWMAWELANNRARG